MADKEEIQDYPFLTEDEFNLACHYLDRKYVSATLGNVRRIFRLRMQYTMTTGLSYISIAQPIDRTSDDLNLSFDSLNLGWGEEEDNNMDMDAEDRDTEALRRDGKNSHTHMSGPLDSVPPGYSEHPLQPYVVFEIHLHPTYRTPVLWFSLKDLPFSDPAFDIDTVYRYLVPDQFKGQLRSIGVMGGISAGNHPITDVPAFFVHPCNTKEAMEQFQCPLADYLTVWVGIVGSCVGLWVPAAMAQGGM